MLIDNDSIILIAFNLKFKTYWTQYINGSFDHNTNQCERVLQLCCYAMGKVSMDAGYCMKETPKYNSTK